MGTKLTSVYSEWDIGQEGIVFRTKAEALVWLEQNSEIREVITMDDTSLDELIGDGLVGFSEVEVWQP